MKKIYGFATKKNNDELAVAITEDGLTIGLVRCAPSEASFRLGMEPDSNHLHFIYNNFFGEDEWQTEFVSASQVEGHTGLQTALKKEIKRAEDKFEEVRKRLASKDPDDAKRQRELVGVIIADD